MVHIIALVEGCTENISDECKRTDGRFTTQKPCFALLLSNLSSLKYNTGARDHAVLDIHFCGTFLTVYLFNNPFLYNYNYEYGQYITLIYLCRRYMVYNYVLNFNFICI